MFIDCLLLFFFITDSPDDLLTMAEKQKIIFRELENIRATESDEHVPGYEFIKLYTGRTVGKKMKLLFSDFFFFDRNFILIGQHLLSFCFVVICNY